MAEPSEFQRRALDTLMAGCHNAMSLTDLAVRLRSNRLAVHSAVRSLERNGWAVSFRSDRSQWAVLLVAPSHAWRTRIAGVKGLGDGG